MKKKNSGLLFSSIFLSVQVSSIFCMEKEGNTETQIAIKKSLFEDKYGEKIEKPDESDFTIKPGYLERIYTNNMERGNFFPAEIRLKVEEYDQYRQRFNFKEHFIFESPEEYSIFKPNHEILFSGQTWSPGMPIKPTMEDSEALKDYIILPGEGDCIPKRQFWLTGNHFRLDNDPAGQANKFYVGGHLFVPGSIKFDGVNQEEYGIFCYKDSNNNVAAIHLVSVNPDFNKKHAGKNSNVLASFDLKSGMCTALALGKNSFVLSVKENEKNSGYVSMYNIVRNNNRVSLVHEASIIIPKELSQFDKLAYLTPCTLLGLTQEKIFVIAFGDKAGKFFYPQKIWKEKGKTEYTIADIAVNRNYKHLLILRTVENHMLLANLSLLLKNLPCFCKILDGVDLYNHVKDLPEKHDELGNNFHITNMWFGGEDEEDRNIFGYIYKTSHYKNWVRYRVRYEGLSFEEEKPILEKIEQQPEKIDKKQQASFSQWLIKKVKRSKKRSNESAN